MKILYILVRTDLPSQGMGKACAQTSHAANVFTEFEVIRPMEGGRKGNPDVTIWREQTDQGFGTVLTLAVNDLSTIEKVVDAAQRLNFPARVVTDPTYPYFVSKEVAPLIDEKHHTLPPSASGGNVICFRQEKTCGYVFGEKDDVDVILARFKLLAND
jgi:peptidyl-tRNA hydrolase